MEHVFLENEERKILDTSISSLTLR
jgi:hypothetical protein